MVPTTRPVAEDGAGRTGRSGDREDEARASGPVVADDGGSGSPVGVIVAVGLVAAIAAVAVVLRRRGRSTG